MASVKIINETHSTKRLKSKKFPVTRIRYGQPYGVKIQEDLPFRVKFINIGIESYSDTNVPPIGIAVIGFNNYIL